MTRSRTAGSPPEHINHEHRRILELCGEDPQSVAEVAAKLDVPLGVARVLVGDLLTAAQVEIHTGMVTPAAPDGPLTDLAVLKRVLANVQRL